MDRFLYLAVTADLYELPVKVAATSAELARWAGVSECNMCRYIRSGKMRYECMCRFLKVEMEDIDL